MTVLAENITITTITIISISIITNIYENIYVPHNITKHFACSSSLNLHRNFMRCCQLSPIFYTGGN